MPERDNRVASFLDSICKEVRWKQAHGVIREDLSSHIEDQASAFEEGGMGKDEAVEKAVIEMGRPEELGLRMDAS